MPAPDSGDAEVRAYLSALPVEKLVDMVMTEADRDDRLFRKLSLEASKAAGKLDVTRWRREIDRAVGDLGNVDFEGAEEIEDRLHGLVDELEALVKEGHATLVLALFDHLLDATEELLAALDMVEHDVYSIAARLEHLHHRACEKARPDPETLAAWLFEKDTESWCSFGAAAYAELLGPAGLAAYRRAAEAAWASLAALGPGEQDAEGSSRRYCITEIMEELADLSGDLEQWVAVKSRDLSGPQPFISIAGAYRKAGLPQRALEWAERGWQAFRDEDSPILRELFVGLLQENGRRPEAIELAWRTFAEQPGLEQFRFLKR